MQMCFMIQVTAEIIVYSFLLSSLLLLSPFASSFYAAFSSNPYFNVAASRKHSTSSPAAWQPLMIPVNQLVTFQCKSCVHYWNRRFTLETIFNDARLPCNCYHCDDGGRCIRLRWVYHRLYYLHPRKSRGDGIVLD